MSPSAALALSEPQETLTDADVQAATEAKIRAAKLTDTTLITGQRPLGYIVVVAHPFNLGTLPAWLDAIANRYPERRWQTLAVHLRKNEQPRDTVRVAGPSLLSKQMRSWAECPRIIMLGTGRNADQAQMVFQRRGLLPTFIDTGRFRPEMMGAPSIAPLRKVG